MDTIQIKLIFNSGIGSLDIYENIKNNLNNLKSPYGYTFCDVKELSKRGEVIVKLSYPRFYAGINDFLITTRQECLIVQEYFANILAHMPYLNNIVAIDLMRVDIPFTYLMSYSESFWEYKNIFKVFAMVYNRINKNSSSKGIIDIESERFETLTYADTKCISAYNRKVLIYDQYKNMEVKTSEESDFNTILEQYPDLSKRIRLEVSKLIKRKPFTVEQFAKFDILGAYLESFKKEILENLMNRGMIEMIYNETAKILVDTLERERRRLGFNYEVFILRNLPKIYDYEVLRRALRINIPNIKTREGAITTVRRILNEYQTKEGIIIIDTYKQLELIRNYIENVVFM